MQPNTWVVYDATSLAELEKQLNAVEGEGFELTHLFLVPGIEPNFVIVSRRPTEATSRTECPTCGSAGDSAIEVRP